MLYIHWSQKKILMCCLCWEEQKLSWKGDDVCAQHMYMVGDGNDRKAKNYNECENIECTRSRERNCHEDGEIGWKCGVSEHIYDKVTLMVSLLWWHYNDHTIMIILLSIAIKVQCSTLTCISSDRCSNSSLLSLARRRAFVGPILKPSQWLSSRPMVDLTEDACAVSAWPSLLIGWREEDML